MKKFTKMAALLMSAVMCAFTSCGDSDDENEVVAAAPVAKVALVATPDMVNTIEGTLKVEFKPSGKSQTINFGSVTNTINPDFFKDDKGSGVPVDLAEYADVARWATCEVTGNSNDTECVITSNFSVKAGVDLSADKKYNYKWIAPYRITYGMGAVRANSVSVSLGGVAGNALQTVVESYNGTETIKL